MSVALPGWPDGRRRGGTIAAILTIVRVGPFRGAFRTVPIRIDDVMSESGL